MFSYISFLVRSTNQHGVHSPFVYELVTKVFYGKSKNRQSTLQQPHFFTSLSKKHQELLQRLMAHLSVKNYTELRNTEETNPPFDAVFISEKISNTAVLEFSENISQHIHNDSVLVFEKIYRSKERIRLWKTLEKNPLATAAIDTYFFGFIFFRKEQQKESFTIRL